MDGEPHADDAPGFARYWPAIAGVAVLSAVAATWVGARSHDTTPPERPASQSQAVTDMQQASLKAPLQTALPRPMIERMTQEASVPPLPTLVPETGPSEASPPAPAPSPPRTEAAATAQEAAAPNPTAAATPDPAPSTPSATGSLGDPGKVIVENGSDMACLPQRMRDVIKAIGEQIGPVHVVSTTVLHTGNHNRAREKLHRDCLAVDFKIDDADAAKVIAFLRQQPGSGGIGHYKNGVIHLDDASAHPPGAYDRD
jgi:hypothetical protein